MVKGFLKVHLQDSLAQGVSQFQNGTLPHSLLALSDWIGLGTSPSVGAHNGGPAQF